MDVIILEKLRTQDKILDLEQIQTSVNRGRIVLNPEFQRNYVYSEEKASSVIQSMLLGMPLGVIYFANIDSKNLCVDGQQRLTSMLKFINNEFPLKKLDVLTELNGKRFNELEQDIQDTILEYPISTVHIKDCNYEQIYFLYEKLNMGSEKLNAQEIRRCVYIGEFNWMLENIVSEGIVANILGDIDNKRLKRVETLLNALAVCDKLDYKTSRKKLLNDYMQLHKNDTTQEVLRMRNQILKVFRLIEDVLGDRAFKYKSQTNINNTLLYSIYYSFSSIDHQLIRENADVIREKLINIEAKDICLYNPNGNVNGDAKGIRYSINKVYELIQDSLEFIGATKQRNFPAEWRNILYEKQDGRCGICGQKILNISNAELDHIIPFSKGGDSNISNAQVTHMHCNRSKGNRMENE